MIPPWKVGTRIILVLAKTGEFWRMSVDMMHRSMEVFGGDIHSGYAMPGIRTD
jgi:hypothetical protein